MAELCEVIASDDTKLLLENVSGLLGDIATSIRGCSVVGAAGEGSGRNYAGIWYLYLLIDKISSQASDLHLLYKHINA